MILKTKYIIFSLTLLFLVSCSSGKKTMIPKNKKLAPADIISTDEEKQFFTQNTIPKTRSGFYDIFFSYIEGNYDRFYKLSENYMRNSSNPEILKVWIELKYFNLFKKDIITYKDIEKLYQDNIKLKTTPLLMKEVNRFYKKIFKLNENNTTNLFPLNKWSISGPYKTTNSANLENFNFKNKYDEIFTENKLVYFKKGGITIPSYKENIYGGIYKLTANVEIKDNEINLYLTNNNSVFMLKIDNKIIFNNDSLYNKKRREIINIKLKTGIHKFTIIMKNFNKEFFIYSDKKVQFKKSNLKMASNNMEISLLSEELTKKVYNLNSKYSDSFKNIILSELILDLTGNADIFYKYLSKIQNNNFYRDYLYSSFYNNFYGAGIAVKSKYIQKYIKSSIKKYPDFYKAKMEYIVLQNNPNPYKVIDELKNIQPTIWYYKLLASYYKKANLLEDYRKTINKIYSMNNGTVFLYKYFSNDLILFDYNMYSEIYSKLKDKLLYKTNYTQDDIDYILKEINNAPYSKNSLYLLLTLKDINKKLFSKNILKLFKDEYIKNKINSSNKDLEDLLNDENSKYYIKADFFLRKWDKYIKFEPVKNIISSFKKQKITENFPTTKLLDYDVAFIEKNYWLLLNRRIIKINNSQGLRKYSNLKRDRNYLKVVTVSNDDLKEYEPLFTQDTSEISLKKLKVGDYIELITYQKSIITPETPLTQLIAFRYKDFNQTVINAKLDLYINHYFNKGERKLILKSKNNFDLSKIKNEKLKNYTLYKYRDNNLKGIKTEPFTFRNGDLLFPSLDISSKNTWKKVYEILQLFNSYLETSNYDKTLINSYKTIKTLNDLKELYYQINKEIKHINSYYGYFQSTYLNKQGNLAYFIKMILDIQNIKSSVLIFHNKYNFLDKENTPRLSYYSQFVLKVVFNNKEYYLDFSNKWSEFNKISPDLYNQFYLRIDNDGNVFKEKLKETQKLITKTDVNIEIKKDDSADFLIKMTIPSILGAGLKSFLTTQSEDRINMIFNAIFSKKLGTIKDFKLNIQNSNTANKPLIINLNFTKNNFTKNKNHKLIITDFLNKEFSSSLYNHATLKDYTVLSNRTLPLILSYFNDIYTLNIVFPEGYKVINLKNTEINNNYINYKLNSNIKNNIIKIKRDYYIKGNKVDINKYSELKEISEQIKKIKVQEITATKK